MIHDFQETLALLDNADVEVLGLRLRHRGFEMQLECLGGGRWLAHLEVEAPRTPLSGEGRTILAALGGEVVGGGADVEVLGLWLRHRGYEMQLECLGGSMPWLAHLELEARWTSVRGPISGEGRTILAALGVVADLADEFNAAWRARDQVVELARIAAGASSG